MKRPYDAMAVLRMSLENVARDFHMHIIAQHEEIQKYVEENLQGAVDRYIDEEMPKLVNSMLVEACREVLRRKIQGYNGDDAKIRQQIEEAAEKSLRKYLAEEADEIADLAMYGHKDALRDKTLKAKIWQVLRALVSGSD